MVSLKPHRIPASSEQSSNSWCQKLLPDEEDFNREESNGECHACPLSNSAIEIERTDWKPNWFGHSILVLVI